jgi:hypothetical protein
MALENLKSTSVTNLDNLLTNSTGQGGSGVRRTINDHAVSSAAANVGSTYRLVRIPTNAVIKQVILNAAAQGATGAIDIDIAFDDSPAESAGYQSFAGGIVQLSGPVDNKLFGSAVAITSAQKQIDITFQNTYTTALMNVPLWNVLTTLGATQFTADPGGFFDIVCKATAVLANGGDISIQVDFVVDG